MYTLECLVIYLFTNPFCESRLSCAEIELKFITMCGTVRSTYAQACFMFNLHGKFLFLDFTIPGRKIYVLGLRC